MAISRNLRRDTLLGLVLTIGFGATALFCIALTRESGGIAALWLPTGLLAAGFVLLPIRRAVVLAAACILVGTAVRISIGAPWSALPIYAGLNLMEATVAALLVRRICGARRRISDLATLLRIALLAILPATLLTALIAGATLGYLSLSAQEIIIGWFAANAVGMAIILPTVLLLADQRDGWGPFRSNIEQFITYGLVALISALAYLSYTVPVHMLLIPALVAAAFRLGPRGVALSALMMSIVSTTMVALGPPDQSGLSQPQQIIKLQFIIATALFTGLSVALILAEQSRTRRQLAMRTRAARRAQDRAQAAGRAKGEFLATMSHEIRTPMNSILGFTQTLRLRTDLSDEVRRQLELIHRAGGSLRAVVNDILDYSRLETGEVELALQPQTGRGVAEDALEILAHSAEAKGLEIRLEQTGPTDTLVMIDDLRVRQILLNLLGNAVKFTSAGDLTPVSHPAITRVLG